MFNDSSLYAIRAMAVLARTAQGAFAGVGQIAEAADVPASYLSKLFQTLGRAGLVHSQKGPGGGFRLSRPADQIALCDVLEPIEGDGRRRECVLGRPHCNEASPCALHDHWKGIRTRYEAMLRQTSLADVANHPSTGRNLPQVLSNSFSETPLSKAGSA